MQATFELETSELQLGNGPIAGVDEAGRGPWAGPVVAAAVILDPDRIPAGIADSKALEPGEREALYARIAATSRVGVGIATVARIDRDNILNATLWAMAEALKQLARDGGPAPRLALIDGNKAPPLSFRGAHGGEGRCEVPFDCRRLDHRQSDARPTDGRDVVDIPGLRVRAPQGLRHARASGGYRPAGCHRHPPPLIQARAAGAATGVNAVGPAGSQGPGIEGTWPITGPAQHGASAGADQQCCRAPHH